MKVIFDTKPTSVYDDDLTQHYQYPKRYHGVVARCVGDWAILRRPRDDGGDMAYFATARVWRAEPDPMVPDMSYARLTNYMEFDEPVPWWANGRYAEESLRSIPRRNVGVYLRGRAVRIISDADFVALIAAGLKETLDPHIAVRFGLPGAPILEAERATHEAEREPHGERVRQVERVLTSRVVRDANFRRSVSTAYDGRCAITGLRIIDGGGRTEAQAAHIWAVADGGPDIVRNGVALSGTVHWLFDRHLISLTDDFRLLMVKNKVPAELRALFVREGEQIYLPAEQKRWPHPAYIAKHRAVFSAHL